MRLAAAALYSLTGVSIFLSFLALTGGMLAITQPVLTLRYIPADAFYLLGPAILVLAGAAMAFPNAGRAAVVVAAAAVLLAALALWAGPRIGWRYAGHLVLAPAAISLLIAGILVVRIKRDWISATIGSSLSALLLIYGAIEFYRGFAIVPSRAAAVWMVIPAVLSILALICSLRFRQA